MFCWLIVTRTSHSLIQITHVQLTPSYRSEDEQLAFWHLCVYHGCYIWHTTRSHCIALSSVKSDYWYHQSGRTAGTFLTAWQCYCYKVSHLPGLFCRSMIFVPDLKAAKGEDNRFISCDISARVSMDTHQTVASCTVSCIEWMVCGQWLGWHDGLINLEWMSAQEV